MSKATVYSSAQYGLADESSATGLYVASVTFGAQSDIAEVPDHIGCVAGFSVYNPRKDVSVNGVVKAKGTALVTDVGAVVTLANTTHNTRLRLSEDLGVTPDNAASIVVTGGSLDPKQNGFEEGSITGIYMPFVSTSAPTTLS